ncbi:hypothetical protein H6F61_26965 [Cyanobacteria bacterium FACHB-472]|nr:hypothetical protein [Cyanobacteria bacterium FACHB-472]
MGKNLTEEKTWKDVQNGVDFSSKDDFDETPRFIRNFRDLATYVHFDGLYETYLNACIYLLTEMKEKTGQVGMDMRGQGGNKFPFPFDTGNPYRDSLTQMGFGTFGGPHILSLVTEVATPALKAVWFQKWFDGTAIVI